MNRLQHYIKEKGLTQDKVAQHVGVNPGQVSKWVSGESRPRMATAQKVAKLLGRTVDELFSESGGSIVASPTPETSLIIEIFDAAEQLIDARGSAKLRKIKKEILSKALKEFGESRPEDIRHSLAVLAIDDLLSRLEGGPTH